MLVRPLLVLNFFVFLVMLSIGLRVSGGQLLEVVRNRALFTRTLLANCVLIPGVGFLLVKLFPLAPDATVGILLLAIPGTPIALQYLSVGAAARNSCNHRVSFPDVGDTNGAPRSPVCDRRSRGHSGYVFVADYIDADRVVYGRP